MKARQLTLFGLSIGLVALIGISIAGAPNFLFFAILTATVLATIAIRLLFPKSQLLPITFASLMAVYASIFALFVESIFSGTKDVYRGIAFSVPILFFILRCWYRRAEVSAAVVTTSIRNGKGLLGAFAWLLPICLAGVGVYLLSGIAKPALNTDLALLGSMVFIGLIVFFVGKEVAAFLVDTGLLFEEFLSRVSRLTIPAFAFLTFYALLVIIFGALYSIISQHSIEPHFRVGDIARPLSFLEAMYFSIVTMSTVGYGDIVPTSNPVRVLVSLEVICGVMLLLFGVSELLEYTREHRRRVPCGGTAQGAPAARDDSDAQVALLIWMPDPRAPAALRTETAKGSTW